MTTVSSTTSTNTATTYSTSTSSTSANSSTVDWSGLIEGMVQAKLDKADTIDATITANEAKISAYQSMQSLLQDLTTKANALSNPAGTSSASLNAFANRSGYLSGNGDVTASNVMSVDVDSDTQLGTYDMTVEQIAKANKISSASVASNSTALGYDGVFSLGTDSGDTADITVTSTMTLADVAEAINNQTDTTGVQATILQVSSSSYQLLLTTTDTGKTVVASSTSGDDVLNGLGITDSTGAIANVVQAAQPAKITLDGVEITRDSNDISDVLDGVTFHLYSTTPTDTSVSVQIAPNLTTIQTAISDFVDSYNSLRDFVIAQSATASDGTADSSAVLFGDSTLRDVAQSLEDDLNTSISSYSLADLGITFDSNNKLVIDSTTLASALNNNLDSVSSLFEFNMTSSSSDIRLLASGVKAPTSFTLDIATDSSGAITSATVDGDSSLFDVIGTRIKGKAGTAYEGFSFSFSGSTSESINISLSYGLASLVKANSDGVGNATSGTAQTLIDNLDSKDSDLTDRSTQIKTQAEAYRTTLTTRYAKIQQAILSANSTISYLKLLTSQNSSSG
ncbi:MAG: flagellar filament capping protein FliD [Rhodopseudomonas sp.]|nr:flagellar filament capping protein FliD [Rhodopseudomonas sp.]